MNTSHYIVDHGQKLKADGPSTDGIISVNESLLMKTEIKLDHSHKTFFISEMIIYLILGQSQ